MDRVRAVSFSVAVPPKSVTSNGLVNPFTRNKRFTVECGACGVQFSHKLNVDAAGHDTMSVCPYCNVRNHWSLLEWLRRYEVETIARRSS